jgi:hypothetical protein
VLQQTQANSRQQPSSASSRRLTTTPNLFAGDGRVRRFAAAEQERIRGFFGACDGTSALIGGDTETVLAGLP